MLLPGDKDLAAEHRSNRIKKSDKQEETAISTRGVLCMCLRALIQLYRGGVARGVYVRAGINVCI